MAAAKDRTAGGVPLRTQLARRVLQSIVQRQLKGGDRLVEEELAARLGVSRTPVREALWELAALGFIVLKPNHGAVVRPFGPTEMREIFRVRAILESEATRLASPHLERGALQQVRQQTQAIADSGDDTASWCRQASEGEQMLHDLVTARCPCARLAEEIVRYSLLSQLVCDNLPQAQRIQVAALREHLGLIDVLLAGQHDAAATAMREHLHNYGESIATQLYS